VEFPIDEISLRIPLGARGQPLSVSQSIGSFLLSIDFRVGPDETPFLVFYVPSLGSAITARSPSEFVQTSIPFF